MISGTWTPWAAALAVLALAGCDQIGLGPRQADSAPPAVVAPEPIPDFRPFAGSAYADFAGRPEFQRYGVAGLGLAPDDEARLSAAMAATTPGWIAHGGGAQALLFTGCAAGGCEAGRGVVAIDLATGGVFAGVRDAQGQTELAPNARLEALLRLSSPNRSWDNPEPAPPPAPAP